MCGFAGVLRLDHQPVDVDLLRSMSDCMWSRGPDDDGIFVQGPFGLSFRRLSILDLSAAGRQPFTSENGELTIVYNGEIYNYLELRAELKTQGYTFRSETDTEVLLAAYQHWGTECLPRLNGMWAFLIYDRTKNLVFGSRDRFGVKPMYRSTRGETHYFASEIKAFHLADARFLEINRPLAARFLGEGRLDGMNLAEQTFFRHIREVPPAHAFTISADGQERSWRYWSLPDAEDVFEGDPVDVFLELLQSAVQLRLRSDVPIGVALSGGMDSSSIIALMAGLIDSPQSEGLKDLHAFSYMSKEFNEERYIMDTVRQTGATLHRTNLTPAELWKTLPSVLGAHDEPLHSPTALVGFQVYGLAAKAGVRVVLGGQGADEVLGGYPTYFSEAWLDLLRNRRVVDAVNQLKAFSAERHSPLHALATPLAVRFIATTVPRPGRSSSRHPRYEQLLQPHARQEGRAFPNDTPTLGLRNVLVKSLEQYPLPLFLRVEDRNSMAHSVEARFPFMDYRLVSFAFRLENHWKINGPWNKYILRRSMKGIVPESVRSRVDKMGFPTGFASWIRGPLKREMERSIEAIDTSTNDMIEIAQLRRLLRQHVSGSHDHGLAIFHALQFAQWHQMVLDRASSA